MITCAQRASERARTLRQFEDFGLPVRTFEDACDPPSPAGNRRNGERVLAWAAEKATDLLFVEDDIDLAADFPRALWAARMLGGPVTFWIERERHHPSGWLDATDATVPPAAFAPIPVMHGWYGTQCVLLPLESVLVAVGSREFGNGRSPPIDIFLRRAGALEGLRIALPNPVEHRSPVTLSNPKRPRRVSRTYHLPRVGTWEEAAWRARMT
jgi:hypothetical protein